MDDDGIDDWFDTKAEELPGAYIIQREIRKAIAGKDFFINDEETGLPIGLQGVPADVFLYYYKIWENFHYFGLPHNQGWIEEREWLIDFLKVFEKANQSCHNFVQEKMNAKPLK